MGRRKRKKVVLRAIRVVGKIFNCPNCGHKTMKVNMKYRKTKEGKVLVKCGHCQLEQAVKYTEITEPIDAYGDFIDIWYKDQEYERLTKRVEKLLEKGQFSELANVYTILSDIAQINADKFLEEYEKDKSSEDLEKAEHWKTDADQYTKSSRDIRDKLATGELQDKKDSEVYDEEEAQPAVDGAQPAAPVKPKKGVSLDEMLEDKGFLEF